MTGRVATGARGTGRDRHDAAGAGRATRPAVHRLHRHEVVTPRCQPPDRRPGTPHLPYPRVGHRPLRRDPHPERARPRGRRPRHRQARPRRDHPHRTRRSRPPSSLRDGTRTSIETTRATKVNTVTISRRVLERTPKGVAETCMRTLPSPYTKPANQPLQRQSISPTAHLSRWTERPGGCSSDSSPGT